MVRINPLENGWFNGLLITHANEAYDHAKASALVGNCYKRPILYCPSMCQPVQQTWNLVVEGLLPVNNYAFSGVAHHGSYFTPLPSKSSNSLTSSCYQWVVNEQWACQPRGRSLRTILGYGEKSFYRNIWPVVHGSSPKVPSKGDHRPQSVVYVMHVNPRRLRRVADAIAIFHNFPTFFPAIFLQLL